MENQGENQGNATVLGLEKAVYLRICYILLLVAGGLSLLSSLVGGLAHSWMPGGSWFGLIGLIGFVMAILGWLAFAKNFDSVQSSHLRYLSVLFIVFFVISVILGNIFGGFGFLWAIVALVINALQLLLIYAGYSLMRKNMPAEQNTVQDEIKMLKDKVTNSGGKAEE